MRRLFICLICALCCSFSQKQGGARRVQAHLLLKDGLSAIEEAKVLLAKEPNSKEAQSLLIEALSFSGREKEAFSAWTTLSQKDPNLLANRYLLEELSWGVLKSGLRSTQYGVRLASLIGAYLTQDVRAVDILIEMMRDSNAVIRSVAVQMARSYLDAPLKEEIRRLMREERVWMVKLEVIRSAGIMQIKELEKEISELIASDKSTYEEKRFGAEALLEMYEEISLEKWKALATNPRFGMRYFAATILEHFDIEGAEEVFVSLLQDTHPTVRTSALNTLGLKYLHKMDPKPVTSLVQEALLDPHPVVAITASWVAFLIDPALGEKHLESYLQDPFAENRRLAAAALARTGENGVDLSLKMLKLSEDPYVKANIALGLLGLRKEVSLCADEIYRFLTEEKRAWMLDTRQNPLFEVLSPSQIRYIDHIPNYPEAIDQMTRLNLFSMLALVEDPRALSAIETFLEKKSWGITGVAAALLLQEGDDAALDIVRELLSSPDPNVELQAALVLAMFGTEENVTAHLQKAYVGADHDRKLHILEAMAKVGGEESFSFLLSAFQEPFPILRIAAASALIQSVNR